jgi:hypothetical protein
MVAFVVDVHGFWGIVALPVRLFLRVGESFDHVAEGDIVSEVAVLAGFRSCSAILNGESIAN